MAGSAVEAGCDVVSRRSSKVRPGNVFDLHLRRITDVAGALGVDALSDLNWETNICELEVAEGDIADQATAATTSISVGCV